MDINTNTVKQQPAVVTPLKTENIKQPVDSSESAGVSASTPASVVQAKKNEYSESDLQQAVSTLNNFVQTTQRNLNFSIDEKSGTVITKVIDSKTEQVIRQIPSEETIRLAQNLTSLEQDAAFNIFSSRA